jgi:hypothetical protein
MVISMDSREAENAEVDRDFAVVSFYVLIYKMITFG